MNPRALVLILAAFLAACSTLPGEQGVALPGQASNTKAVASLVDSARAEALAGRLGNAAASMERAIRLEPRNPRLWHELAQVRLQQGEYAQAEQVAMRSNSLIQKDMALRTQNWQLIAQARERRGDAAGARNALELAKQIRY